MEENLYEWSLIIGRWVHITTAVTWIGTSIFFMWLDRTFIKKEGPSEGDVGELWMVHGGGFYKVEKKLMGSVKTPVILHWFKWEAYWTWISGMFLLLLIFYTGGGNFLIDSEISDLSFSGAAAIGLGTMLISWVLYDLIWESPLGRNKSGHALTALLVIIITYLYCKTLSGRAAYIHMGALLGTWMVGNVLLRIIPRQLKMVKAAEKGESVNPNWAANAKARSTHNTYFTLPVIFIMLSNHFPSTYGHEKSWLLLLSIIVSGALIRQYFVVRHSSPKAKGYLATGVIFLILCIQMTFEKDPFIELMEGPLIGETKPILKEELNEEKIAEELPQIQPQLQEALPIFDVKGNVKYLGKVPVKKHRLPRACDKINSGNNFSRDILVDNDKNLKNAIVYISKGLQNSYPYTGTGKAKLDQEGCFYRPKTIAIRVGQELEIFNSDPIFHNVKAFTEKNKRFNKAMPKQFSSFTKVFTKPELPVKAKCSVHPWMRANIAVFDHPFYSVTNEKGEFHIVDLPKGKYMLTIWHETLEPIIKEIEIKSSEIKNLEFILPSL